MSQGLISCGVRSHCALLQNELEHCWCRCDPWGECSPVSYPVVKVSVWLPPEARKQHLGEMTMGIQRGSGPYLLVTSAELVFSLLPISGKSITVVRRGKYFFLFLSMWITLPTGKSCPAHCVEPATVTLHQEQNVWQCSYLGKGLVGQEPGLAKPQLDPALGKPLFSF